MQAATVDECNEAASDGRWNETGARAVAFTNLQKHSCSAAWRLGYASNCSRGERMGHTLQYIAAAGAKEFTGTEQRVDAGSGGGGARGGSEYAGEMRERSLKWNRWGNERVRQKIEGRKGIRECTCRRT
jgi:hypothetical protein